ncbi:MULTISPECIES: VWA domain-containing protein [unclassified Luteimonas]|uniref:VWA domain-containing protein n=1 Tax=unclassified Luteimonas TaxID=2629088 RepID=UPI0018F05C95|nr:MULTISPECIES: VWA domain-containing protein [unclassified Luteimonas]MBJ6980300.1 VWA domain-containing protein [Luteimonas sp. MC1895]MBJ6983224.1 VWA domain-containing protein [Luteimonas sp. MC1750]QQO05511.1 VWA domain-containing protein [Luteimonas sp. MC1750]
MTLPFGELGFLRPAWLLALLLLPLLAWQWRRRARQRSVWRAAVDPHLLPHLLVPGRGAGRGAWAGTVVLAGLGLAILALAGPSWRSVPQPLQAGGGALVLALDLSGATLANDLQPSRLAQARARLDAILRAHTGDVALVVYADDAHVVSPMTDDAANVSVFLDALAPDIMPVDGARPGRAIDLAVELLVGAGHAQGEILLLAPGADTAAVRAAARAAGSGHRVSALAMGTAEGAGYRGRDGGIHRSVLDRGSLEALAAAGGGRVHDWSASVGEVLAGPGAGAGREDVVGVAGSARVREDGGYWLLPAAMVLLLAVFRRGGVLAVLAVCMLLPVAPSSLASTSAATPAANAAATVPPTAAATTAPVATARTATAPTATAPTATAWRRADQAAHARSVEAEAAYRRGDFAAAARGFAGLPGADAAYNRGNALARAGRYEEAIAAYDDALRQSPGMPDAAANRAAVEAAMQREPPPGAGGGGERPPDAGGDGRGAGQDEGKRGDDGQAPPDQDPGKEPRGDEPGPQPPPRPTDGGETPPPPDPASEADARARQQAADEAQREAMQRAIDAGDPDGSGTADDDPRQLAGQSETTAAREREEANAAWLRRVPDDPGALLRARFRNEHLRRRAGER